MENQTLNYEELSQSTSGNINLQEASLEVQQTVFQENLVIDYYI